MLCSLRGKVSHRAREVNPMAAMPRPPYARGMSDRHDTEQAARRELDKLRRDGDALGGIFARWFTPATVDRSDPIEVWGTRIGRGIGAVAAIAICLYLVWAFLG
jgi:hypothetical protein